MERESELLVLLAGRMHKEYEDFIEALMHRSPKEIISASFEKVFKEDILAVIESGDLSKTHMLALLREPYPLDGCYQRWLEEDVTYMDDLRYCIESHASSLQKRQEKMKQEILTR